MQQDAASTKVGTGKHLGLVLLAWAVFFLLAGWVLPRWILICDQGHWCFVTLGILLALPTVSVITCRRRDNQ